MGTILNSDIVKREIDRIKNVRKDFEDRNVVYDISILNKALESVDGLVNGKEESVKINCDMWEECNNSLDLIVEHYGLRFGDVNEDGTVNVTR